jgi:hypothetical protein
MPFKPRPFDDLYIPEPNSGCWLWLSGINNKGYGIREVGGRRKLAHRISYEMFCGEIPDGLCVLHRCDTPLCINPRHLLLGTKLENTRDMDAKGRRVNTPQLGSKHGMAKLTEADVIAIRNDPRMPQSLIAKDYGVTKEMIYNIKKRRNWKHLP